MLDQLWFTSDSPVIPTVLILRFLLYLLPVDCSIYKMKDLQARMDMLKKIPTHMDYVGQGRAEKLYQIIIGKDKEVPPNRRKLNLTFLPLLFLLTTFYTQG